MHFILYMYTYFVQDFWRKLWTKLFLNMLNTTHMYIIIIFLWNHPSTRQKYNADRIWCPWPWWNSRRCSSTEWPCACPAAAGRRPCAARRRWRSSVAAAPTGGAPPPRSRPSTGRCDDAGGRESWWSVLDLVVYYTHNIKHTRTHAKQYLYITTAFCYILVLRPDLFFLLEIGL